MVRASRSWRRPSPNSRSTRRLAEQLANVLGAGRVLALVGDLGAGKTTFVQGLARGWGVANQGEVLSPTYTLVNEYPAERGTLVHVDLYRLDDENEAMALGIDEQLRRDDALVVVEWADRAPNLFDEDTIWVRFSFSPGGGRLIAVEGINEPAG